MDRRAAAKLWVGTSGYSYKHWKDGVFYPPGLPEREWFEFYQDRFPTVELNITFYSLPAVATFKSWHARAKPGFLFFVKGSRYITHLKRLKDPAGPLRRFFSRVRHLKEKMAGTLWQLPPRFKSDPARLQRFLKALARHPAGRVVLEFRDESWLNDDVTGLLRKAGAAYCFADLPDFYKRAAVPDVAPFVYVRRHGPGKGLGPWYPERTVAEDAGRVRAWLREGKEAFVYYNNDGEGAAIRNALTLWERAIRPIDETAAAGLHWQWTEGSLPRREAWPSGRKRSVSTRRTRLARSPA
jgi:uncharacterized protein YecE (DUF72 family)